VISRIKSQLNYIKRKEMSQNQCIGISEYRRRKINKFLA